MMFDLYNQETIMDRWKIELENKFLKKGMEKGREECKNVMIYEIYLNSKYMISKYI